MYLSLNWIKNWLNLPKNLTAQQLALDLTMSTVEVEEVIDQAKNLQGIVVGKIEQITKHPQADLLQVCQVNIGTTHVQIVCGGSNLSNNMLVAVATVGSKVKWHGQGDWVELSAAKIRGVDSHGMIVAASEIGLQNLAPDAAEREILDLTGFKAKPGQALAQALGLDDKVIDIDNKSINHRPDLWGQYGLARELAAIYRIKLAGYSLTELKYQDKIKLKINIQDKDNCFRYSALAIQNVKVGESPWWLKLKLLAVGLRPINNIVDVTNYVMYELGQPLHAFDARQVSDHNIIVKLAKKNEKFVTLDGVKRKLTDQTLMIADNKKYLAIAGIMGGQNSEINADTTEIIIESANFRAANIRRSSQALGLRSDSSARFEKSLDPNLTIQALQKAAQLILAMCPEAEIASQLSDIDNSPFRPITLSVSEKLLTERIGMALPTKEIKDILTRLQFDTTYQKGIFTIKVPSFRATKDISIPEDIVEEVARIHGYDKLEYHLPMVELKEPIVDVAIKAEHDIKRWLAWGQGYSEVYTYPFVNQAWAEILGFDLAKHIKVKNSISPESAYLNLQLLPNLLNAAEGNFRWSDNFRIFELERVFDKSQHSSFNSDNSQKRFLPQQAKHLAGVELSSQTPSQAFWSIKGLLEALFEYWGIKYTFSSIDLPYANFAYEIKVHDVKIGNFGLLKRELFTSATNKINLGFWELDFSTLVKYISQNKKYELLPKYPGVNRDMAVVVAQTVYWRDLEPEIYKVSSLIRRVEPFDVFMGEELGVDKKSIAYHLEFRSEDRTLLAEDVDKLVGEILVILKKKFGAVLR